MADIYIDLASAIINEQENIIGPIAWMQAKMVKGLKVTNHDIEIKGDRKETLGLLVKQYESLFGRASVEVCKDAVRKLIIDVDKTSIPEVLL